MTYKVSSETLSLYSINLNQDETLRPETTNLILVIKYSHEHVWVYCLHFVYLLVTASIIFPCSIKIQETGGGETQSERSTALC